jgi:hypothetical protein
MTKRCTVASDLDWTTGSTDRRPMVGQLIGARSHTENHGAVTVRDSARLDGETSLLTLLRTKRFSFFKSNGKRSIQSK